MKTNAQFVFLLACLTLPMNTLAGKQEATQRAGEISRVIPSVSISRGANSMNASEKTIVDWQDTINTQANGRARVSLDDGSVLNMGSDSALHVIKHDAGAQQTSLELVSGKMRVQARKLTLPGAKFEVTTSAGIAGVTGTDFYVGYENNQMTVAVFEGNVKVCNLAGVCVDVAAGLMTTVHAGDNTGPSQPSQATQNMVSNLGNATSVETGMGLVSKAVGARIGNTTATEGETVFSGDLLSTQGGGNLLVRVGSLSLQLEGNSSAYIFRAPYGAVAEVVKGSAIYERPEGPQNIVVVASDVRLTPALTAAGMGRIGAEDPCKISLTVQRGQASVRVGTEEKQIEAGKSYRVAAEYAVSTQEAHSPDADDYHSSHYHRPCAGSQTARHTPVAPGHSKFIYVATGTAAIVTIIAVTKAFESPDRP